MDIEIAIVGASSAGLFAAELLARAGRRVAVFERQPALNHARRSYIITPQIQRVLADVPAAAVLHHTPHLELIAPGAAATIRLRDPDLIIERATLIRHLAERATAAGAQLLFDHRLHTILPHADKARLQMRRRDGDDVQIDAATVIGADGVFSDVARAAGMARPPVVQIVQAELALPAGYDPQLTRVWFDPSAPRYFFWLIPESTTHGVLGVIGDDGEPTRRVLDGFLERQGLRAEAYQASHVAMYHPHLRPWSRIGNAPVFLIGDAAGQVKVTTVGGNVTGFYGAAAAVRCLIEGVAPQRAFAGVHRELEVHWWLRRLLERFDSAGYAGLIKQLSPALLDFLARHNRDEMAGAIWQVPLLRPQLLGSALAGLLRPALRTPLLLPTTQAPPAETARRSAAD